MKKYFFSFLILCTTEAFPQDSNKVTKSEVNDFIKQYFYQENQNHYFLIKEAAYADIDSFLQALNDSFLNPIEKQFMLSQFQNNRRFHWREKDLDSVTTISNSRIKRILRNSSNGSWSKFHEKIGPCYFDLSVPLFSPDRRKVVFYFSWMCDPLNGRGMICLYHRIDNEWKFVVATCEGWVS